MQKQRELQMFEATIEKMKQVCSFFFEFNFISKFRGWVFFLAI
jgi:hypothetical protein